MINVLFDLEGYRSNWKKALLGDIRYLVLLVVTFLGFITLGFGHFKIPSESMQPTLEVGDHIYVSKFAYGYNRHSLPFNFYKWSVLGEGRIFARMPKRGDVIVFRGTNSDTILIKRLVGLPGDVLSFDYGRVFLNGELIDRELNDSFSYRLHSKDKERLGDKVEVADYNETFEGEKKPHRIYERGDDLGFDNSGKFVVPDGHVFFIGDNRDYSSDSRAPNGPSYVPLNNLIGRADLMVFSFKKCAVEDGLKCPPKRYLLGL